MIGLLLAVALAGPPDAYPNPSITPGVARPLTTQQVCSIGWGKDERHVDGMMKAGVFKAYGLTGDTDPRCTPDAHGQRCEVDHLISRELGGADDLGNLWPQRYGGAWNAHDKDRIENALHVDVCAGKLTLQQAQDAVRTDWVAAYLKQFGGPPK